MQHNIQEKQEETQCAAMGIQCFFLFMGMMLKRRLIVTTAVT